MGRFGVPRRPAVRGEAERNELAAAHVGWAREFAGHLATMYRLDRDDCFGAAQLGLLRAAEQYDPRRDAAFPTYATYWVRLAVGILVAPHRTAARLPTDVALGRPTSRSRAEAAAPWRRAARSAGQPPEAPSHHPAPDAIAERREEREAVDRWCRTLLDDRERAVLTLTFGDTSLREAGAAVGVSGEYARILRNRALAKLRRAAGVAA